MWAISGENYGTLLENVKEDLSWLSILCKGQVVKSDPPEEGVRETTSWKSSLFSW